ncbi:response regulator [Pedobacter cryoconitis]|nr:response regulator [Pedobacter cryoconitis]
MKRVIVQDTDLDLLTILTFLLEEASFEVLPVSHCKDVASKINSFDPQLIVLDFRLSGEECTCLCAAIKKDFPCIPIVALSCNHNIQKQYAICGFDDYVAKPFDIEHLLSVMRKY